MADKNDSGETKVVEPEEKEKKLPFFLGGDDDEERDFHNEHNYFL